MGAERVPSVLCDRMCCAGRVSLMVHLSYAFLAKSVEAKDGHLYTDGEGLESIEVSDRKSVV